MDLYHSSNAFSSQSQIFSLQLERFSSIAAFFVFSFLFDLSTTPDKSLRSPWAVPPPGCIVAMARPRTWHPLGFWCTDQYPLGNGPKSKALGTTGFGLVFFLPIEFFAYPFLTHSNLGFWMGHHPQAMFFLPRRRPAPWWCSDDWDQTGQAIGVEHHLPQDVCIWRLSYVFKEGPPSETTCKWTKPGEVAASSAAPEMPMPFWNLPWGRLHQRLNNEVSRLDNTRYLFYGSMTAGPLCNEWRLHRKAVVAT